MRSEGGGEEGGEKGGEEGGEEGEAGEGRGTGAGARGWARSESIVVGVDGHVVDASTGEVPLPADVGAGVVGHVEEVEGGVREVVRLAGDVAGRGSVEAEDGEGVAARKAPRTARDIAGAVKRLSVGDDDASACVADPRTAG